MRHTLRLGNLLIVIILCIQMQLRERGALENKLSIQEMLIADEIEQFNTTIMFYACSPRNPGDYDNADVIFYRN